jgi:hypothetical protein
MGETTTHHAEVVWDGDRIEPTFRVPVGSH